MHVRVTHSRGRTKTYRSVQIVQSFRRPDGMPANKVLGSFGDLPELETNNLRAAVAASRQGKTVVIAEDTARAAWKVARNLAYYDVALCFRIWQSWGLSQLIDGLTAQKLSEVSIGEVAAALTVQRCVEPDSKLAATRWYRTTALPLLQGISPSRFNNARVHRVLDCLEQVEQPLQDQLARRVAANRGPFVCLFLDCTDTWFVGRGPELAHKRVTKEGLLRNRIGIVLLCDSSGYPLRWATVPGNHHEARTMRELLSTVCEERWFEEVPFVVDRAMGKKVTVNELVDSGLPFVTAVPIDEIANYSPQIPLGGFDDVTLVGQDRKDKDDLKALKNRAREHGFVSIGATRQIIDLGVFSKADRSPLPGLVPSRAVAILRLAHMARRVLDSEQLTHDQLADRWNITARGMRRYLALLRLDPAIQERIMAGEADRLSGVTLRQIARCAAGEQQAAFAEALAAAEGPALKPTKAVLDLLDVPPVEVRGVVLFDPERFLQQRHDAHKALEKLQQYVDELNRKLVAPSNSMKPDRILANIGAELKHRNLVSVFQPIIETQTVAGREAYQLRLLRDDEKWQRRRQADGLMLIIANPSVDLGGAELVELYFAKDKVEKDFKQIKSVLELRPVLHHTDAKVRAHVTLCMLALLVERDLEERLSTGGLKMTAEWALHALSTAKLNQYDTQPPIYSATTPDRAQQQILAAVRMTELADDDHVAETLGSR